MREAVKPALEKAISIVRVGKPNGKTGTYERGGALKRSLRIKVVQDKQYERIGLVGSTSKSGRVGWRAHFLEHGTKFMDEKPFAKPAEAQTQALVEERLQRGLDEILKNELESK